MHWKIKQVQKKKFLFLFFFIPSNLLNGFTEFVLVTSLSITSALLRPLVTQPDAKGIPFVRRMAFYTSIVKAFGVSGEFNSGVVQHSL